MTQVSGIVVVDGVTKTRLQWCEHYGITSSLLSQRMSRLGITLEEAVRMGGRKGNAIKRARAAKAAIPLPDVPLRQCANDPNCYVTEDGRVWNHIHKRWMTITVHAPNQANTNRKYAKVRVGGEQQYVQTVVAAAWLENPANLPWVWHRDNDTLNNHKDNLVWSTKKDVFDYRKELKGSK
ncbi:hypothetical protein [Pseudomonas sp. P8_250]|uniref:hypothetical protein n=1 Tax=Pseudomonas sp. P8_250 TaxID=3043446 RepID=UPI002A35C1BA|nr:hypothetical protein [Pseudomonas sp. P8_250]MDX9668661.1 hypothetical protein [Pseudomonas sp. P8_250]